MDEQPLPPALPGTLPGTGQEFAALALRVAALERQVALLTGETTGTVRTTPGHPGHLPLMAVAAATAAIARVGVESATTPPPFPQAPAIPVALSSGDDLPRLAMQALSHAPQKAAAGKSLETRLGATVFNLVGIVALLIATAYGLKLAIEHGYFNPVARVLAGLLAGIGVILWSERIRRRGMAPFSYSLKAVGSAVLYLSLWASFHLYHQLPVAVALGAMILVTAWNAFMAWSQDAELLAAYALLGGFLTPLLLATGGNHETFLFTYVAALDLGVAVLLRTKPWRLLLLGAFPATVLLFTGWYTQNFGDAGGHTGGQSDTGLTIFFVALLFSTFAVISVKGWVREGLDGAPDEPGAAESYAGSNAGSGSGSGSGSVQGRRASDVIVPVLLPLADAAFLALALYSIFQDSGLHRLLAFLMVGLAALYLGLMRVQRSAVSGAMHLAMAIIFLTVAIPLKASGHTLTTAWLVEGLVLFWASTRFGSTQDGSTQDSAARLLQVLSAGAYVLGLGSLVEHWAFASAEMQPFLNRNLAAALVAVASLGGAVYVAMHAQRSAQSSGRDRPSGRAALPFAWSALAALDGVAVLLTWREIFGDRNPDVPFTAFLNADFGTALLGLAILAGILYMVRRYPEGVVTGSTQRLSSNLLAAVSLIAFNLLAILSVEREIGALWHRTDANLQRSLALSGFLMAYGAGLLAVGFWKRIAFVRWQALVLLVFTICKVFLYDIGSLSAGYRVASLFGLGAVLMAVSFAYQKDWLGLRVPTGQTEEKASRV